MTSIDLATVIVLGVLASTFGIVGLTRPSAPPACTEAVLWIRTSDGAQQSTACDIPGHRVELHEHESGAVYAVCRCPEPAR